MSAAGPYRKLALAMWQDRKFRALSSPPPSGQTLWITLIAGEHTSMVPGLSRAGECALAEALGWAVADFRAVWKEIEAQGMAQADWDARVVWVPNAIKYNPPENPNVVKSWALAWSQVPECALKDTAAAALIGHMRERGEGFIEAFSEACPSPFSKRSPKRSRKGLALGSPNQEQEPEPEPEPEPEQEQEPERGRPAAHAGAQQAENDLRWLKEQLEATFQRGIGGCGKDAEKKKRLKEQISVRGRDCILAAAVEVDAILRDKGEGPLRSLAALPGFLDGMDFPNKRKPAQLRPLGAPGSRRCVAADENGQPIFADEPRPARRGMEPEGTRWDLKLTVDGWEPAPALPPPEPSPLFTDEEMKF